MLNMPPASRRWELQLHAYSAAALGNISLNVEDMVGK